MVETLGSIILFAGTHKVIHGGRLVITGNQLSFSLPYIVSLSLLLSSSQLDLCFGELLVATIFSWCVHLAALRNSFLRPSNSQVLSFPDIQIYRYLVWTTLILLLERKWFYTGGLELLEMTDQSFRIHEHSYFY